MAVASAARGGPSSEADCGAVMSGLLTTSGEGRADGDTVKVLVAES